MSGFLSEFRGSNSDVALISASSSHQAVSSLFFFFSFFDWKGTAEKKIRSDRPSFKKVLETLRVQDSVD